MVSVGAASGAVAIVATSDAISGGMRSPGELKNAPRRQTLLKSDRFSQSVFSSRGLSAGLAYALRIRVGGGGVSSEREGRKVVDQTRGRARGGRAGRTSAYPATYLAVPPGRRSAAIRASGGSKRSVLRAKGLLSLSILSLGIASLMSSFCGAVVSGAQGASVVGGRLLWAERGVCRCGVLA